MLRKRKMRVSGFEALVDRITKEELYQYVVVERHTNREAKQHFNIGSSDTLLKLLKYYGLKKPTKKEILITKASREELYQYYIVENHTFKECIEKFNLGSFPQLKKLCNYYNIVKNEPIEEIIKRVPKNEIIRYYIEEKHSHDETLEYFNLGADAFYYLLKLYGIFKERFNWGKFQNKPTKETLYNLYVVQNKTAIDISAEYNISKGLIIRLLKEYGISLKTMSENVRLGREKVYKLYGSKENYCKATNNKVQQTMLKKYGFNTYSQMPDYNDRVKSTNLKKYGVEYYTQSQENRDKISEKLKEKINILGYAKPSQANLDNELLKLLYNEEESVKFLNTFKEPPTPFQLQQRFNCGQTVISHWIERCNLQPYVSYVVSNPEKEIEEYLKSLNICYQMHSRLTLDSKKELDFYIPDYNIGIEFNGTYWHSSLCKDKNYHYNKSIEAETKGIRIIHIWEYEWEDSKQREKILSLLKIACNKVDTKIYARNCTIKEITNREARSFNEANHLQGHRNAQVTYGLFYNDKLVQLMSFSKTRYNKNLNGDNDWEIIRGCPASNNIVVGGVSKLFKHFLKEYNPNHVFSYCDFNKFDGRGYEAIGMRFVGYTGPDMKWLLQNGHVVPRQPSKHKELKEASKAQLWGAGSKKYIWEKPIQN